MSSFIAESYYPNTKRKVDGKSKLQDDNLKLVTMSRMLTIAKIKSKLVDFKDHYSRTKTPAASKKCFECVLE